MKTALLVLAVLFLVAPLHAQVVKGSLPRTVEACVTEVRRTFPGEYFDAYAAAENDLEMFGTAEAQFAFRKCMNLHSEPTQEKSEK